MCKTCLEILSDGNSEYYLSSDVQNDYCKEKTYIGDAHCICGQVIQDVYVIRNKKTNILYNIGNKCINDLFPENKELIDCIKYGTCIYCNMKIAKNYQKKHIQTKKHIQNEERFKKYRYCVRCKQMNVKQTSKWSKCKSCNNIVKQKNIMKKFKQCNKCKDYNINKDSDDINCKECTKILSKMEKYNQCPSCEEYNIKKDSDFKACFRCNRKKIKCSGCDNLISKYQEFKYHRCFECNKNKITFLF